MNLFKPPGKIIDNVPSSKSSSPTIGETTLNSLPVLTEVEGQTHPPSVLSAEEMQQLLHQLESHLGTLFTKKLSLRLEQLQRQAIDQALDELKAELPELLRDALDALIESR
jgi:hypothetical protein